MTDSGSVPKELLDALADAVRLSTPEELARLRDLLRPRAEAGAHGETRTSAEGGAYTAPVLDVSGEPIDLGMRMPSGATHVIGRGEIFVGGERVETAGGISITTIAAASASLGDVLAKAEAWAPGLKAQTIGVIATLVLGHAFRPAQAPATVVNVTQNITVVVPEPGLSSHARVVLKAFRDAGASTTTVQALATSTSLAPTEVELALKELVGAGKVVEIAPAPGVFGLR